MRRYQIQRAVDDPNGVTIDPEFERRDQAEAILAALRMTWERVTGTLVTDPEARIVEPVESGAYPRAAS